MIPTDAPVTLEHHLTRNVRRVDVKDAANRKEAKGQWLHGEDRVSRLTIRCQNCADGLSIPSVVKSLCRGLFKQKQSHCMVDLQTIVVIPMILS